MIIICLILGMKKTLQKYEVATVQYEPSQFKKDHNIDSLLALCEKAAKKGAKLIVTPEMGTTGYCFLNREEISPLVEEIPLGSHTSAGRRASPCKFV